MLLTQVDMYTFRPPQLHILPVPRVLALDVL